MRIAIIGGGISGLAAAWGLHGRHETVLFEAADYLGGHTHTIDVEMGGAHYPIDTGFIVFNDATYPHFIRLLSQLDIRGQVTDMSFSVAGNGLEYASHSLGGLFAQRRRILSPQHWRMLAEIIRFNREAPRIIDSADDRTLLQYLQEEAYTAHFIQHYMLPLCAAIWSASMREAALFPAEHFVRFFSNHGLLQLSNRPQWRVVPGGSAAYVRALQARLSTDIRINARVTQVKREAEHVLVSTASGSERFDQVIFACHSDQALTLLDDASDAESRILSALAFSQNEAVLHTDRRILPNNPRAWASWNFRIDADQGRPAAITYHMNRLQGIQAPVEFCVTLNQRERIDAGKIIGQFEYAHPVYTRQANAARQRRDEINGRQRSWFCGAYWYNGFHEDGARSALDVAQALGGGW